MSCFDHLFCPVEIAIGANVYQQPIPVTQLLGAGYWHTTFFPQGYWAWINPYWLQRSYAAAVPGTFWLVLEQMERHQVTTMIWKTYLWEPGIWECGLFCKIIKDMEKL